MTPKNSCLNYSFLLLWILWWTSPCVCAAPGQRPDQQTLTRTLTFLRTCLRSEQTNIITQCCRPVPQVSRSAGLQVCRSPGLSPATTTLLSEGHQNLLVNAAFVLPQRALSLRRCSVCSTPNNWEWGVDRGEADKTRVCVCVCVRGRGVGGGRKVTVV